nr:MAG TPA: hypothetical protein [Caudoviricetes sp.]
MLYCGRLGMYSLLLINTSNFCSIRINFTKIIYSLSTLGFDFGWV